MIQFSGINIYTLLILYTFSIYIIRKLWTQDQWELRKMEAYFTSKDDDSANDTELYEYFH